MGIGRHQISFLRESLSQTLAVEIGKTSAFLGFHAGFGAKLPTGRFQMDFERLAGGSYWSASASTSRHASRSGTRTIMPRMVAL